LGVGRDAKAGSGAPYVRRSSDAKPGRQMEQSRSHGGTATWTGFMAMAFAVLGLLGAFSTYAAQIPFDRAMARNHTLDQVLAAASAPDPAAALAPFRALLGDEAGAVLSGPGTLADRVDRERDRMITDLHAQSQDYGLRLRIVIAAFTAASALFGVMIVSIVGRTRPG
jgi:hypothetical protein